VHLVGIICEIRVKSVQQFINFYKMPTLVILRAFQRLEEHFQYGSGSFVFKVHGGNFFHRGKQKP